MIHETPPVKRTELIVKDTIGLGDVVGFVAQPIAGAIDKVVGTNLKGCGGCRRRKVTLNEIIPDIKNPFGG